MTRKVKVTFSPKQKLEYAKLMVEGGYSNIQVEKISGAGKSAVSRWKQQYLAELNGNTPVKLKALTPEQQRIQELEAQLKRAQRDNDILKKAAVDSIGQCNNHVKTCSCRGSLDEAYIYSKGKSVYF